MQNVIATALASLLKCDEPGCPARRSAKRQLSWELGLSYGLDDGRGHRAYDSAQERS